jgi:hypothetical protein
VEVRVGSKAVPTTRNATSGLSRTTDIVGRTGHIGFVP